jgi:hypothetical protein
VKNASKKFRELDVDGSGTLEGIELLNLAEWMMKESSTVRDYAPSHNDVVKMKNRLMQKFNKGPNGEMNMREMAILHEELLVCTVMMTFETLLRMS